MKLRTGAVYSMQFHKEIVYFNPKMDHVLDFAIVDEFNRAGFVVAPYSTPEEESSVKRVSGPARHVGEAGNRVRSWRGWVQCAVKNSMAKIKKCPRGYWRCSCWRPGGWYWCRAGSGDRRCGWGRGWRCGCLHGR